MATRGSAADRPPGPEGLPVVGNTHQFARDRLGFITRTAREYGDVVALEIAGRPVYHFHHPDHVRRVLVADNEDFVKGEFFQRQLGFLGNGLLNSEGEFWRRQRHLIEPAFHPDRIAGYVEMMVEYTERTVDAWEDGETRNVHSDMMQLTLEIVAKTLFDVDIGDEAIEVGDALSTLMAHFRRSTTRPASIPEWVPTPANLRYRRAVSSLDSIVYGIIDDRRDDPGSGVISRLIAAEDEYGDRMSERQIRDEVLTLLLAGHETTAQALSFTWHLLARYPGVERELVAEVEDVLGGDPPEASDVPRLDYAERVVKEAMRLYPPVPGIVREPLRDVEIDGYRIPTGSTVGAFQWVIHRDPRFYDDPKAFVPDRWTESFERERHPFAYFPFGGGPRRCIGDRFALLEARVVLATILRRFHLELRSEPDLDLSPAITLRPKGGIEMAVHER